MQGLDPPAEKFTVLLVEHPRLRVYVLQRTHTLLAWCRDKENDWRSELAQGKRPEVVQNARVDFSVCRLPAKNFEVRVYNPWTDRWNSGIIKEGKIILPAFTRSLVIKIQY